MKLSLLIFFICCIFPGLFGEPNEEKDDFDNNKIVEVTNSNEEKSQEKFSVGSLLNDDVKLLIFAFDYAFRENSIVTIYWLLRAFPFLKYAKNDKLKSCVAKMFTLAWNYVPEFSVKFRKSLHVNEMFEELSLLLLFVCSKQDISSIPQFVFEEKFFNGKKNEPITYFGKLLQSRNLTIYEATKRFILTFLKNEPCLVQKLQQSVAELDSFDKETFMLHIFTKEQHKKHPVFVTLCTRISNFPVTMFSEDVIEHAEIQTDTDLLPPSKKCYAQN